VKSNGINVYLDGGESKIYVPQSKLAAEIVTEAIFLQ